MLLVVLLASGVIGYYLVTKPGGVNSPVPPSLGVLPLAPGSLQRQGGAGGPAGSITTYSDPAMAGAMGGGLGVLGSTQQKLYSQAVKGLNAIPVVGPALSQIAGSILNIIDKHHAAALAAEGKALNDATPRMIQTFAMIVQAAATGEIRDQGTANDLADKTVALFYGEVKPIQRGNWPYTGKDMTADYVKVWLKRFQPPANAPGYSDYHAPDPCNAACVIGHFFAERNAWLVKYAVADILAGNHGVVTFPQIPAYATQQGYPEMDVSY